MGFKLKDIIFSKLFSNYDTVNDINKINNKGLNQRFNELLADDLDENVISQINNLIDNTLVPENVLEKFIPYLESLIGLLVVIDDLSIRRKLLENAITIYKFKGTIKSYDIVFKILGFTNIEVEKLDVNFGFDSPVDLDNQVRVFDYGKCFNCIYYNLNMDTLQPTNTTLVQSVYRALRLIEPIYAQLKSVQVNGNDISQFNIFIDNNGDLIYETTSDIVLVLDNNGDLQITGSDANDYYLDDNGNLIYNG